METNNTEIKKEGSGKSAPEELEACELEGVTGGKQSWLSFEQEPPPPAKHPIKTGV